jgi:hypothetical protein
MMERPTAMVTMSRAFEPTLLSKNLRLNAAGNTSAKTCAAAHVLAVAGVVGEGGGGGGGSGGLGAAASGYHRCAVHIPMTRWHQSKI